jgi:hypothetical protein
VDGSQPAPRHPFRGAQPVATGEARQVGLVHRDDRQAKRLGCEGGLCPEDGGARQVHDVRRELAQHFAQLRPRAGDAEVVVSGQRQGRRVDDTSPRIGIGAWPGSDDECLAAAVRELLTHAQHAVGDAVN